MSLDTRSMRLTLVLLVCSVGLITNATQAEKVLQNGEADVVRYSLPPRLHP